MFVDNACCYRLRFDVRCSTFRCAIVNRAIAVLAQAVAVSRTAHLAVWAMGSVSDDYVCPWCGRVGNGGYAPDWVGYPICTEGRFSCLWLSCLDRGIDTVQEFRRHQLRTIFPTTYRYNNASSVALDALAACLSSPPSRLRSEPQQDYRTRR